MSYSCWPSNVGAPVDFSFVLSLERLPPLPPLPQVAMRIMRLAEDDGVAARDLARALHSDQGLATKVLALANTPAFRPSVPVVSLGQAIPRLGFDRLRDVAIAESLRGVAVGPGPHKSRARALWKRSVASGQYAKEIARVRRDNVESAFLCGLLQTIGQALMLRILSDAPAMDAELLQTMLDEQAVRVGLAFADQNSLPEEVKACIAGDAARFPEAVRTSQLADAMATALLADEAFLEDEHQALIVELNLYDEDLAAVLEKSDEIETLLEAMGA